MQRFFATALVLSVLCAHCSAGIGLVYVSRDSGGQEQIFDEDQHFPADLRALYCVGEADLGEGGKTVAGVVRQLARYEEVDGEQKLVAVSDEDAPKPILASKYFAAAAGEGQLFVVPFEPVDAKGEVDPKAPLPTGQFECVFSVAGRRERTFRFVIDPLPCRQERLFAGQACFQPEGLACPRFGNNTDGDDCLCQSGAWSCVGAE